MTYKHSKNIFKKTKALWEPKKTIAIKKNSQSKHAFCNNFEKDE